MTKWKCIAVALSACLAGCGDGSGAVACDSEPVVRSTADGVDYVRTPDACFDDLPDWPYEARHVEIDGLRQAYVDEGPADGEVVLLLHGQPSWSYLYRKMIPGLVDAGHRVIAMDHLGMGRSDKPTDIGYYSYLRHNERLEAFIAELDLQGITLFVQDWGSLIGLRVAGLNLDRFARIAVGDGALPVIPAGVEPFPPVENPDVIRDIDSLFADAAEQQSAVYDGCDLLLSGGDFDFDFGDWMIYAMTARSFRPSEVVEAITWFPLTDEEEAAYDAPFPSRIYMGGPRTFPSLINDVPGTTDQAWENLQTFERPFVTIWASNDAGNLGSCDSQDNLICNIPGAEGQPHTRLPESSHFLQDDQGEEIARRLVAFMAGDDTVVADHTATCGIPIAPNGTGTPCSSDAECAGLEANLCLSGMDAGFCTVEDCSAGSCIDSFVCCRGCNPAAPLPFDDSACLPEDAAGQLAAAGCTCD